MSKQELLKHMMELFPVVGHTMGDQELKFNIIMKYSSEPKEVQKEKLATFEELLKELEEKGVLSSFEFNGMVSYKAKKEIPVNLAGAAPAPAAGGDQLNDLADLVLAIADATDNKKVKELADQYRSKY